MRSTALLALVVGLAIVIGASDASAEGGKVRLRHFFNFEWFRDADGDGIPNCLDDDWTPPQDGTGYQDRHGFSSESSGAMAGSRHGQAAAGAGQGTSQSRYRHGSGNGPGLGDQIRSRLHLRDGSCTQ